MPLIDLQSSHVLGYVRVSTEEQTKGYSPAVQEEDIRKYCTAHSLTLVHVFRDLGRSGKTVRGRTGILGALALLRDGGFGALIVAKEDRLARRAADAQEIGSAIFQTGAAVITLDPMVVDRGPRDRDPVAAQGRQLQQILAEDELDRIRGRVVPIITKKALDGNRGGHCPLGYTRIDKGRWVVDDQLAPVVRELFTRVQAGESLYTIQKDLAQRGVTRPDGKPMTLDQVKALLRNRWYTGEYRWRVPLVERGRHGDEVVRAGHHAALIDPLTFAAVQESLERRSAAWRRRQPAKTVTQAAPRSDGSLVPARIAPLVTAFAQPTHACHGIVPPAVARCACCSGTVYATLHSFGSPGHRVRRPACKCYVKHRFGNVRCQEVQVDAVAIDAAVSAAMRERIQAGTYATVLAPALPADLTALDVELARLERQRSNLTAALERADATVAQRLRPRLDALAATIAATQTRRQLASRTTHTPSGPHWEVLRDFDGTWPGLTNHQRRQVVAWLIARVTIGGKAVRDVAWHVMETRAATMTSAHSA